MQTQIFRWQNMGARKSHFFSSVNEDPLRAELFSAEQLARHAGTLAQGHRVATGKHSNRLLSRLSRNEDILRLFNRATLSINSTRRITPAAEWLLDNYYLIEEQIQMARRHLPRGYSRELPRLMDGPSAELPRVYDIVLELISHVDAQVDAGTLSAFVAAYQTSSPLNLGELWAIPIMLRLGLIENLQRVTSRLILAREHRDLANLWVDRLQEMAEKDPSRLVVVVADMAKAELPVTSSFVSEFCQRLSLHSPELHLARGWMEQRLSAQGLSIEQLIQRESQNQAADQVSVSHSIGSLRFLSAMDWKEFVETLSLVDVRLRDDPADVYRNMDFATRDSYRHSVETLARHSEYSEVDIAQCAIDLALKSSAKRGDADRASHVGYYLIDKGRPMLGYVAKVRWPWRTLTDRIIRRFPMTFYAGGIGALTGLATSVFLMQALALGLQGWRLILFPLLFLLCASQLAVPVMNWLSSLLVSPASLPRMDYSSGIAPASRTIVAIPTMLTSAEGVQQLVETLENHHLANRDNHLHFALLTDFRDAAEETMPDDAALLQQGVEGIEMLNRKYASGRQDLFFLCHRPRRWNAGEGVWMGYERKRGKLTEFNDLLRGRGQDYFSEIVGDTTVFPLIKYVITLDTDTQLPRDAARLLAGTMAHPLNRPVFDAMAGRVTEGYSILQPRIGVSLPSARRSWFVRLYSGDAGIDPYTRAVSDVYQDVFREGSFIGKGIYDVDAFQRAIKDRFPENAILSHDLLEGCFARSALVSNIELYEEYPSRYNVDVDRRHRWTRGDWQIAQWLFHRIPGADAGRTANPLSVLSQWKIFDNLRRSLVPVALIFLVLGIWGLAPDAARLGLPPVLLIMTLPGVLSAVAKLVRKAGDIPWIMHLREEGRSATRQLVLTVLSLTFLPYDAFISLDAIGRTLLRLLVTRKRLLEWQTSSDSARKSRSTLASFYARMWIAPLVALASGLFLADRHPVHLAWALPLLVLWCAAPRIAWFISQPIESVATGLTASQLMFLRQTARKTWFFFETFVTDKEHWLPPDNFQEIPDPLIASRTSPTNMGLALLANLAARDFGYLPLDGLIRRTQDALATMEALEHYRGHFYNWYDTRSLKPLLPLYVSSVDSGNLAGHLLPLASGLREEADKPIYSPQTFAGLLDTAGVLGTLTGEHAGLAALEAELTQPPIGLRAVYASLKNAKDSAIQIAGELKDGNQEMSRWAQTLESNCKAHLENILFLAPWLALPSPAVNAALETALDRVPTLREVSAFEQSLCPLVEEALLALSGDAFPARQEEMAFLRDLLQSLRTAGDHAREYLQVLEVLAMQCDDMAVMDFTFLFDRGRELFVTGFNVAEHRCDTGFYDLLASEARLCSYVAIALGQVPQEHWFRMGRLLVASRGDPILVSWSGSMFEYLMPLLVMPNYDNTLLDHTCKVAVKQQIAYGKQHGVPWGISEAGYNRTDLQMNYQYRAFGVPGLGLKRGLAEDLVVAPYATVMALMISPQAACRNLKRLKAEGHAGAYGFYEAVDYTPVRLPPDKSYATIRSYMAHHQGMSLLALVNLLHGYPMQRRFMNCPMLKATDLLLQERIPKTAASVFNEDLVPEASPAFSDESVMRIFTNPSSPAPAVHLLSNSRYQVVISSAGGGYSRWRDLAVTRWREDATRDSWGTFMYVRDLASGEFWSTAYQPVLRETKGYEAIFTQARAEFRQRHNGLEIHTEICVSPEDDVELRRVTITNCTPGERIIELTSYAEVVLASQAADAAHPAFSNLFVNTEFVQASSAILCNRRPRSEDERPPWLLHLMAGQEGAEHGEVSCETDRARFIGRGGTLASPAAMQGILPLSNTVGSVLDPVISLRRRVTIPPHGVAVIDLITGVTQDREAALGYVEKYQNARMGDRAFEMAWTHSQVMLHQINASEAEAQLYARLASALIYANPERRADPGILRSNRRGQSGLWSYGVSGDTPIVLLRINDSSNIEIVRQLIRAHSYWRMKGLMAELIILNEDMSVYNQPLQEQIISLIASGIEAQMLDQPGGIFVRRLDQIPADDRVLLQSVARIVLEDSKGTLAEQLEHHRVLEPRVPAFIPTRSGVTDDLPEPIPPRDLIFQNGFGGFTPDGREYVITLQPGTMTPAPWVNVLANPFFGTVVSESGSAYTWVVNAHEFRLTPWHNDPVRDTTGEAFYIRDEQTGKFWSPTPLPARGTTPYVIRHGFGYTVFEHTEYGIASELWVYVAMDAPVKFAVLKLRNVSGRPRRMSLTGYWEWVLGEQRNDGLMHVQTEVDPKTGALLARNYYNTEFSNRIVFIDVNDATRTVGADRRAFIGRNGSLAHPAAMNRTRLSGKVGAGFDPCGAVQVSFELADGETRETSFRLGAARHAADAHDLILRFRRADASRVALEGVWEYWNKTLGAVNVDTPDPAVNMMANGWLLYQTIGCRLWGRTGFYQSGGAYGFRDQLQDVMALVHAEPALTREHLLRAASHQFSEGDVQHWWHPPADRGVRTHFSDDFLWLPYVTCRYVTCIADTGILNEKVPFLEGRPVRPEEDAYYDLPDRSDATDTLYQHCVRAIENGLKFGKHGLPLMGGGDWNDGMNLVGEKGRGESVWLAFFLYDVLTQFSDLAHRQNDLPFAERCVAQAKQLKQNIEKHGWDGKWYRRAYFDNGEPLGSQTNPECQIDSLPQSWSVISGGGDADRSLQAMQSVNARLVRRDAGLIQLFDPPFDTSSLNPGYIKGYIPGVRENGGQYTHAALWAAMAFAQMGEGERAWELFTLLNPVRHGGTPEQIAVYKVEPYVIAADVYAVPPHTGRGGWTWYTGAAGWMYRLLVENLLGVHLEAGQLHLAPVMPEAWTTYKIHYRYRQTLYHITINRIATAPDTGSVLIVDGKPLTGTTLPLCDDQQVHFAELRIC